MGLVTALRELWRFRWLVLPTILVALAIAVTLMFRVQGATSLQSRDYQVGIASARALVDTDSSQLVDLGTATGADLPTLSARAQLLANLMTSSPLRDEIARRAGVPDDMLVTPSAAAPGGASTAQGVTGTIVSADDPRANILKTSVPALSGGEIPIIAVETQAPDPRVAARLANQAIAVLQRRLTTLAGTEAVPTRRRVVVRALGPARSQLVSRGPSPVLAVAAGLIVLLLGCGIILLVANFARLWRQAGELSPRRAARSPEPSDDEGTLLVLAAEPDDESELLAVGQSPSRELRVPETGRPGPGTP